MDLQDIHPRDLMYVTDPAQSEAYALPSLGGHTLEAIMRSVAQYRRQSVRPGRRERISKYMRQFYDGVAYKKVLERDAYEPLESNKFSTYLDEYPQTSPGGFAILDTPIAEATKNDYSIDIPQPPFKTRQIDPLVQVESDFKRLSEVDPSYAERLTEHREALNRSKVARLTIADPKVLHLVKQIVENADTYWQHRLNNSRRMTAQELGSLVSVSSREIFGAYPFMSYIDY